VLAIVVARGMGSQIGVADARRSPDRRPVFRGLDQYRMLAFCMAMV